MNITSDAIEDLRKRMTSVEEANADDSKKQQSTGLKIQDLAKSRDWMLVAYPIEIQSAHISRPKIVFGP